MGNKFNKMKSFVIFALVASVSAQMPGMGISGPSAGPKAVASSSASPPTVGLGHAVIPATREDFNNAQELWKGDWAKYRPAHPADQDCSISESDNWKGARQCSQSWECRGARLCERGGWCSGYDGLPSLRGVCFGRLGPSQPSLRVVPLGARVQAGLR